MPAAHYGLVTEPEFCSASAHSLRGWSGSSPLNSQRFNHAIDEARGLRTLNELVDIGKPPIMSFGYGHRGVDVGKAIAQNPRTRQRSGLDNEAGAVWVSFTALDSSSPQQFDSGGNTVRPDQLGLLEHAGQIQIGRIAPCNTDTNPPGDRRPFFFPPPPPGRTQVG